MSRFFRIKKGGDHFAALPTLDLSSLIERIDYLPICRAAISMFAMC
jgi:hypothetical protein